MPDFTPNFSLPYPAPTDEPCDFAEQWCDFTAAIDAVFNVFEEAIARTIPIIPVAMLRLSQPASTADSEPIIFDSVVVDTARMTDLDANPYTMTIPRPGRYTVAMMAGIGTQAAIPPGFLGSWVITEEPDSNTDVQAESERIDVGGALGYYMPGYEAVVTLPAGTTLVATLTAGSVDTRDIQEAWLAAFWHSDNERPS